MPKRLKGKVALSTRAAVRASALPPQSSLSRGRGRKGFARTGQLAANERCATAAIPCLKSMPPSLKSLFQVPLLRPTVVGMETPLSVYKPLFLNTLYGESGRSGVNAVNNPVVLMAGAPTGIGRAEEVGELRAR